MQKRVIRSV